MSKDLGAIANSRTPEQVAHMQNTVGQGKCPFCDDNGFDANRNIVIIEGEYWRGWQNPFPYPHHRGHIVLATHKHITSLNELPIEAFAELFSHVRQLIERFDLPGGAIVMRFGANEFNAGTLRHLHVHIQVPDNTGPAMAVISKDDVFSAFLGMIAPNNPKRAEQSEAFLKMIRGK